MTKTFSPVFSPPEALAEDDDVGVVPEDELDEEHAASTGAGGGAPAPECTVPATAPSLGSCVDFTSDAGVELDAGVNEAGVAAETTCNPVTNEGCTGTDVCGPDNGYSFYCQPAGSPAGVAVCGDCTATGATCAAGAYCGPAKTCVAGGMGISGAACTSDADCASGLRCDLEGFSAECLPEGTSDVGGKCGTSADCPAGQTCQNDGEAHSACTSS